MHKQAIEALREALVCIVERFGDRNIAGVRWAREGLLRAERANDVTREHEELMYSVKLITGVYGDNPVFPLGEIALKGLLEATRSR